MTQFGEFRHKSLFIKPQTFKYFMTEKSDALPCELKFNEVKKIERGVKSHFWAM